MLVTLFLKLPMPFWQILNSIFLTGICYLATQILKNKRGFVLSIMFFFLASLSITITRQSTYWLTGSFNYIYPIFLLFAYCACLIKISNNKYFAFSIILGLLASATMEQSGMMAFGLTVLSLLTKIDSIKNIKLILKNNGRLLILTLVTLLGVCTVVLAPAQFVRIQNEQNEISTLDKFINNSEFLLDNYTMSPNILPYCIIYNLLILLYLFKNEKKSALKITISLLCITNILLNIFAISLISKLTGLEKILFYLPILLLYLISFIYINKHLYNKFISPLTITLTLMLGSQFMMLFSPVFGPRNLIFGLIMFAFLICLLANKLRFKYTTAFAIILFAFALVFNFQTANGYKQTKKIDETNKQIIFSNTEIISDASREITLYTFPNDDYGWSMPYISSYHEFYFKHFYDIKCKINWVYPND